MRFDFTKDEHDFFVERCRFNPENGELMIFEMRCAGKSIVEISLATNMSTATAFGSRSHKSLSPQKRGALL